MNASTLSLFWSIANPATADQAHLDSEACGPVIAAARGPCVDPVIRYAQARQ